MKNKLLLIIEDNPSTASVFANLASHAGMNSEIVFNGEDAILRMSKRPAPDILLLDMGLPDLRGRQVFDNARKLVPRSKIIITSANPAEIIEFIPLSDATIPKPIVGLANIVSLLRGFSRNSQTKPPQKPGKGQ